MKNLIGLFLILIATSVQAQLRLPSYFSDHAVLQRNQPVRLWGWSSPGSKVSITIASTHYSVKTASDSIWRVELPGKPAGGPYHIRITNATEEIAINDIYYGDVYFCSGQSNMAFTMNKEQHRQQEGKPFPLIRQLLVSRVPAISPQKNVKAEWLVKDSSNFAKLSAVAYYFAKALHQQQWIAIGIINASWGGSPIETFMSPSSLNEFQKAAERIKSITPEFVATTKKTNEELLKANPGMKNPPGFINIENQYPTMLYNGMVSPFFYYPIKGVVWYQGENNAHPQLCNDYEAMLNNMIDSWRRSWNNGSLPFFIVQLANYGKVTNQTDVSGWAIVQEAQANLSKKKKHVGLAVINDIGDTGDIHPRNKRDVGNRLAAQALEIIYNNNKLSQGPRLKKKRLKGSAFELTFENTGAGLVAKDGAEVLYGFLLAGEDHIFYKAKAEIRGNKVVVYSKDVPKPVHVRYAFESSPEKINFYNKEGFPAVPFRTDQLKEATKRI